MIDFKTFISEEELEKIHGTQYGSNEGGIHVDSKGNKHYVKRYDDHNQAKVEALTGKIYKHMGIHTAEPELHKDDHIKSKWNEHLKQKNDDFYKNPSEKHAHQLSKMYHGAVLTKNWDIIGTGKDNVLHNEKTGNLHAIDHGGAMHYRAMGGHKEYGPDNDEKESLRQPHHDAGEVFNAAFKKHPHIEKEGLEAVKNIDDAHIHKLFKNSGLHNWKDLHKNFQERKKNHLKSYE